MSPEALETSNLLSHLNKVKINFVCIDEVHCVSEWSHNFRTSYLRINETLSTLLKEDYLLLGLTATATINT